MRLLRALETNKDLYRKIHYNIWFLNRNCNELQRRVASGDYSGL